MLYPNIPSSNSMDVKDYLKQTGTNKRATPEHDEQVKVFEWAEIMKGKYPQLELLFAIPNGAFYGRHWSVANKMKAEGVKKGVPDIFLAVPVIVKNKETEEVEKLKAGLWIEMKAGKNKTSPEQDFWLESLMKYGYEVKVCYSSIEAIETIVAYLNLGI